MTNGSTPRSRPSDFGVVRSAHRNQERRNRLCAARDDVDEEFVDTAIAGHLGMKRRRQHSALADRNDVIARAAEHTDVGADPLDPRRPDEHRVHGGVESDELDVAFE